MADFAEAAQIAAGLIDRLEQDYQEYDDVRIGVVSVRIGVVSLVAEVEYTVDGDEFCSIEYRCSDGRRWIQLGLFESARRGVIRSSEHLDDDDD